MKIVVLAGGRSTERNVSLSSAAKITNALRSKGHRAVMVDLFLGIELPKDGQVDELFTAVPDQKANYAISDEILTDADIEALRTDGTRGLFGKNVLKVCQTADIVYLGLHGEDGENGNVQAVLKLNGIRHTGSSTLASGLTMNKSLSKQVMLFNDIPTAHFVEVKAGQKTPTALPFGYPVVVKPTNGGSSIGMTIVKTADALPAALQEAYRFDSSAVIEEFIGGREFSLGVVNGVAMPAIEIKVNDGWYDFEHKFQPGHTTFVTPPDDLTDAKHKEMQQLAIRTMEVLGLENYGRIDFFLKDDQLYVIEGNSLPGMTPLSLLPQEAAAAGISYPELVDSIVQGKMAIYQDQETED